MKQLSFDNEKVKELKIYLTRTNLEIATAVIIFLCALSMFLGRIPSKQSLTLDNGKMVYTGYVANNKLNGQGKLTFSNGDTYQGNFKNGVFDGKGTFKAKAGWTYVGQFKKGVADGQGKLTTETNIVYEGKFKEGIYQDAH